MATGKDLLNSKWNWMPGGGARRTLRLSWGHGRSKCSKLNRGKIWKSGEGEIRLQWANGYDRLANRLMKISPLIGIRERLID